MTNRLAALGADRAKIRTVHNWVPGEAVRPLPWKRRRVEGRFGLDEEFVAMYSGNLGLSQKLEDALYAAKELKGVEGLCFLIIGEGCSTRALRTCGEKFLTSVSPAS